jgi:hypothetical protein
MDVGELHNGEIGHRLGLHMSALFNIPNQQSRNYTMAKKLKAKSPVVWINKLQFVVMQAGMPPPADS